jgi:hypothetical protein
VPILNGSVHELAGPTTDLLIGVSQARREALERGGFTVPKRERVRALIDTGAGVSGVDLSILLQLDLRAISQRKIYTASTPADQPHTCDEYDVSLFLPFQEGELYLSSVLVIATPFVAQERAAALIGRDVLSHCHFTYNGTTRTFSLAF